MKNAKAPILWVMLIGLIAYNIVNAFVVVEKNYTYVENERLFSEFKLTQEYEVKLNKIKQQRQDVLDSLELVIRNQQAELKVEETESGIQEYRALLSEYNSMNERFNEQNGTLIAQYDDIIWKQLNSYVKSYGEEKGYNMILGVAGEGNIMYADEALNVTGDLIKYVNDKYNGE